MDVKVDEIRSLLAELILEERISGAIDQVAGVLELRQSELATTQKHSAIERWAEMLVSVNSRVFDKLQFMKQNRGGYDHDDDDDFGGPTRYDFM